MNNNGRRHSCQARVNVLGLDFNCDLADAHGDPNHPSPHYDQRRECTWELVRHDWRDNLVFQVRKQLGR